MRTILSLALLFGLAGGTAVFTGCEKKAETKHETKDVSKTPGGGEKETTTESKTTETPGKNEK